MNGNRKPGPITLLSGIIQRRSDLSYRDIAEQFIDATFLVAPRTGLFRYFNSRAIELTGYSREELEKLSLSELLASHEAAETLDIIRSLEVGLSRNIQNAPIQIKSGKQVYVDLRVSSTAGVGEQLVLLLARDDRQRIARERSNKLHARLHAYLVELAGLLKDPGSNLREQTLPMCQQLLQADMLALYRRAEDFLGFRLHESVNVGQDFPASIGGIDPVVSSMALNWRAGMRPTSLLTRAARAAGLSALHIRPVGSGAAPWGILAVGYRSPDPLDIDVEPVVDIAANFVAAVHDVGQLVNKDAELARQAFSIKHRFHTLLAEMDEGAIRIDAAGQIVELNPAAQSLLGYTAEDAVNLPLEDVLVSAQPLAQPLLAALQEGQRWGGAEADLIRRDGASVAALVRAIPLAGAGERDGGLILLADRTDQRQFQAQSDHLERRAWLGDLSAIFAHDVRNPLNGIATGLSYLAGRLEPTGPLAEAITKMQAEVNRIEQLLKNVLLVAKSAQLEYKPVPLHHLLERALARWGTRFARRNVQLVQNIDPGTPLAMADTHQIDQVFTNLIVNAYDAMSDKGGTLSVKCHAATHPNAPRGEFVELLFGDTGPGIPPDLQPRIFDPFITTKSSGTGLGLAITKRIVTAHKGTIFVESWPGIGTAFHVFIPVARDS